jgi:hypothetical protein
MVIGIVPVIRLLSNAREVRADKFPIDVGISPDNLLTRIFKLIKALKLPMDCGSAPLIRLPSKLMWRNEVRLPISEGRVPFRLLPERESCVMSPFETPTPNHVAKSVEEMLVGQFSSVGQFVRFTQFGPFVY